MNRNYSDDYIRFLKTLDKRRVEYLIIGAYSVMIHTRVARATKNMDVWVRQSEKNALKLSAALKNFGDLDVQPDLILKPGQRIELKGETFQIEIWTSQEAVNFEEAWSNRITDNLDDFSVNVISKSDLIKLKKHFNRPQDRLDVELLKKSGEKGGK